MRTSSGKSGRILCLLAGLAASLMPLAGMLHGLHCHNDPFHLLQASSDDGESSLFRQSAVERSGDLNAGHCPDCRIFTQLATAVVFEAPPVFFSGIHRALAQFTPDPVVRGVSTHAIPFSRAPPAV